MTQDLPPFTSHRSGRLLKIEFVPSIDASEIAWSGALDGICDPGAWPWSDWAARDRDLQARGWIRDGVALRRFIIGVESPTEIRMRAWFGPLDQSADEKPSTSLRQLLFFESTPCAMGGRRWWFVCWLCGKRRAKLYRPACQTWDCRQCLDLTYRSRQDYNSASRHGGGWRRIRRFLDRDETRWERIARRNMRRGLSRWRKRVRESPECVEVWPVQVTGRPSVAQSA